MESKAYLDKVIGYMVRGTRIDYDNDKIENKDFLDNL